MALARVDEPFPPVPYPPYGGWFGVAVFSATLSFSASGHAALQSCGIFRVTASLVWSEAVLAQAIVRFHNAFPAIELRLETTTRVEGLRRLEHGESDLHCGGIDEDEPLPDFLRRERFLDVTAGIVASRDDPLLSWMVTATVGVNWHEIGQVENAAIAGWKWTVPWPLDCEEDEISKRC